MRTVTVEEVISWGPCYPEEKVREMARGHDSFSPCDILRAEHIKAADRLWVALHRGVLPDPMLFAFACSVAEHVLPIYEDEYPGDPRLRDAIATRRCWLRGEASDEELADAREATWAAWDAAEEWAARAATWAARAAARAALAAAWAAARAAGDATFAAREATWAAWDAAGAAAWAAEAAAWAAARAAEAAAWAAARAAERDWQVLHLLSLLESQS